MKNATSAVSVSAYRSYLATPMISSSCTATNATRSTMSTDVKYSMSRSLSVGRGEKNRL